MYLEKNRRVAKKLVEDQSGKLAFDLFRETRAIAPSAATIRGTARAIGERLLISDRILDRAQDIANRARKGTGRGKKGSTFTAATEKRFTKELRKAEIARRINAIGFAATGWLPAMYRFGKSPSGKVAAHGTSRGGVSIYYGANTFSVEIYNSASGIAVADERYKIVNRALGRRVKDMIVYIRRKQQEEKVTANG